MVVKAVDILHQTHLLQAQFGREEDRRQVRPAPPKQGDPPVRPHGAEAGHHHHLVPVQRLFQMVGPQAAGARMLRLALGDDAQFPH